MDPKIGQLALDFLARVDLKGSEAPAFMACVEAIKAAAQPMPEADPGPAEVQPE